MAEPFRYTTGRWYNKPRDDGDGFAKAPLYKAGFTYEDFKYGTDTPATFLPAAPDDTIVQQSLICSKGAAFLAVDVDYPENLPGSAAGEHVSWANAISTRGSHFHVGVDMRGVAPEDWPVQGRTAWGDVKASGFIPVPGSVHYSGEPYAAAPGWQGKLLKATPELLAAIRKDRDDHALARLNDARQRLGTSLGTRLPDGSYLYSSGYVGGSWGQLPDGFLQHDDELKDLVWDMHVEYGLEEPAVHEQWQRLAGALGKAWTERDFTRHWHRVPARRAERLEEDDGIRFAEDFGLKAPPTPLEAAAQAQEQAREERAVQAQGFGPPTPPQPDGIYEDSDEIPWFHVYLGTGLFDAGRPTDAGNAEAVLYRARYALRHDEEADTWLKRVAGRWVQDADAAKEAVTALGRLLPEGCADPLKHPSWEHLDAEADRGTIGALKRQAKNFERFGTSSVVNGIAAMMKNIARARLERWMTVRDSTVDADPEVLWAGGVPWDLRASYYGPVRADRVDRHLPHLHSAGCVPDASVATPLWDQLLDVIWPPKVMADGSEDRSMQQWALLVLSAGVTGYPKKAVPLLKGGTDRGKSTVIDAIADLIGTYFRPLNSKILDAGASTHDTVLMELKGTRLTFLDEGIQRGKVATARLKRLVGGSSITANRMRQDPVTFRPTHTLAITLNPEENFSFEDPAIDSRVRLLPCNGDPERVIAVAKQFNYYQSPAWLAERPGVLAKLMRAAAVLLNDMHALDKDHAPLDVRRAEQDIKDEEDDVLRWFLEATEDCPGGYPSRELYIHFKNWTAETLSDKWEKPATETKWGRRMNELVPDDDPKQKPLVTQENSKLRRRKPRFPGSGGFATGSGGFGGSRGAPTASDFMAGQYQQSSTVVDRRKTESEVNFNPPETANSPENPPGPLTRAVSVFPVSSVSSVSSNQSIPKEEDPPTALVQKGTGETHRVAEPTGTTRREPELEPASGTGAGEPVVSLKSLPAETGENGKTRKNADSPPNTKNPKIQANRLTEEEKAERVAARKVKIAGERVAARAAKVAELGGPLVPLPAIVLRDQSILPCTAEQAAAFLSGALDEVSVDVEHTGYPRTHKHYRLRLVQLGNEGGAVVLDPGDETQAGVIRDVLAKAKVLHAHSALADLIPLEAAGLCDATVWDRMRDTLLAAKLVDPALCDSDEAALKPLAKALLGPDYALSWKCDELRKEIFAAGGWIENCEVTTPTERSGWANIPVNESFVRYAGADVMDCSAVARVLG